MISKVYDKLSNLGWVTPRDNLRYPGKYYLIEVRNSKEIRPIIEENVIWYSWGYGSIEEMKVKKKTVSDHLSVDSTCLLILNERYVENQSFGLGVYHE